MVVATASTLGLFADKLGTRAGGKEESGSISRLAVKLPYCPETLAEIARYPAAVSRPWILSHLL